MPKRLPGLKFHKSCRQWYETIDGKQVYLGADHGKAKRRLASIMRDRAKEAAGAPRPRGGLTTVARLFDAFVDHVKATKNANTALNYRMALARALYFLPANLPIEAFDVAEVDRVVEGMMTQGRTVKRGDRETHYRYGANAVRDTLATMRTACRWARKRKFLTDNPLDDYPIPARRGRNRLVTPEEFQRLLKASRPHMRRVLIAMREIGCRPAEIRAMEWEHVDFAAAVAVLPDHKTLTQQEEPWPRILALSGVAVKLLRWLKRRSDGGSAVVFHNGRGGAWTKDSLGRSFARARDRAGIEGKAPLVLYSQRHTFGTNAVGKVSDMELAAVMGHTSPATTRRYVHLSAQRLRRIRERIG